jgi:AcrR family transcriptional regulator
LTGDDRRLRADAQRNREQLLAAAVAAFSGSGPEATLDSIARAAGVGIGTLYRHFPSREALIDAAYRSELARLCDSVPGLLAALPPDQALRAWMDNFVDYMTTKRGMAEALRAVVASGGNPFAASRARLLAAIDGLLQAGARAGLLRPDVSPDDVLVGVSGVSVLAAEPSQRDQAGRLLDLIMDGLRYTAPRAGARAGAHG